MVSAPEHTELEMLLMKRVWALEEALMGVIERDGFLYKAYGAADYVQSQPVIDVLDTLPWLVGK